MTFSASDKHFMRSALTLARRGLGRVAPNPSVGCVIVKDGYVLGRARTADGGRPHAETQAIAMAGADAKGATAYVTLEPCAHQGQTGPCADALVKAGIKRVVIACGDPDPRVAGKGAQILKDAGVIVEEGLCRDEAEAMNKGFFLRVGSNRPLVTLKIASSLDAKVASASGESKWITGDSARSYGHLERSQHDAIGVGINTVLADDPSLTTRLRHIDHAPVRIVFDTDLRFPDAAAMLDDIDRAPVWIVCGPHADAKRKTNLESKKIKVIAVKDLNEALHIFAQEGLTRLMIEGGPAIVSSFIRADLFDRVIWFRNHSLLGAEGKNGIGELGLDALADKIQLKLVERRSVGANSVEIFERNA